MEWLLFGLFIFGIFYTWLIGQKAKAAQQKAEQINERLYGWGNETRLMLEDLRKQIRGLEFQIKRQAGEFKVTADMRIAEVLSIHPRMKEVLASLHLGGCSSCHVSEFETLGQGASSYGLDTEKIIEEINIFLNDPDTYEAIPKPHGGPGMVQIQLPSSPS